MSPAPRLGRAGAALALAAAFAVLASCGTSAGPDAAEAGPPPPTAVGTTASSAPVASAAAAASSPETTAAPTTTTTEAPTTSTSASTTSTVAPPPTDGPEVDPGTLPQTRAEPARTSPLLDAHVQALWHAIVTDDAPAAMPFFFPRSAYLTVKAIADPAGDYERRLVADYTADLHVLHARLGADPTKATLGGFTVPAGAQWIDPGVEHNAIGYWRVYGATLGWSLGGRASSFPIASMISWRGQWYVVHLDSIR